MDQAFEIQNAYYTDTAAAYDAMHVNEDADTEHHFASLFLSTIIEQYKIDSILDVGAGTGRTIIDLRKRHPHIKITGIEPVKELRERGYEKGIPENILIDGNGKKIDFPDNYFDLVCEFGMLHHVDKPAIVVSEMLRVAKKAIFISDSNNFGQGSPLARFTKQMINAVGLWPLYNHIRTKGKKYQVSEGDGLFYSYSVFNNYPFIKKNCRAVHILSTGPGDVNPYRTASHVALVGFKK